MFSEPVANFLCEHVGKTFYFVFAIALLCLPPIALFGSAIAFWAVGRSRAQGVLIGLGFAVWASLCDLCVPYLGTYPNLPGYILWSAFINPDREGTPLGLVCVHATNFVLWPGLGWVAFWWRS